MKKRKLLFAFLGILSIGLLGILGSYAWYSFANNGLGITSITTNGITFSYKEGSNALSLNDAMPMPDDYGKYQEDYFEFEINSKTPAGIKIPYYITARKSANSSDIDDAIKIGLTKVIYNENDIYDTRVRSGMFTLEECENDIAQYGSSSDTCVKIYSAGEAIPDSYTFHAVVGSFTLDECQEQIANAPDDVSATCVEKDGAYAIEYTRGQFDSLEQCQSETGPSGTCIVLSTSSDVFEEDMYAVEYYGGLGYDSLEECEEEQGPNKCELAYRAGTVGEEEEIKIVNYSDLSQYEHKTIDLSKYTEKLLYRSRVPENTNYKETYRIRMWIDENTDFTQAKYNNANFGLTINVYSDGKIKSTLAPGLYDDNNNLLASWDDLVNMYDLNVEYDNSNSWKSTLIAPPIDESIPKNYMFGHVIQNNPELANGSKLIIGEVESIGDYAFAETNLKEVIIPETVQSIGYRAFYNNPNLTSVTFEDDSELEEIGEEAFRDTGIYSINVPKTVQSIGYRAFYGITDLQYAGNAADGGDNWGARFRNAYFENNIIYEDATKTKIIGYYGEITSIVIPNTVTQIAEEAFYGCESLISVTLEENSQLATIGNDAFNGTNWYNHEYYKNCGEYNDSSCATDVYLNGILLVNIRCYNCLS